MSDSFTMDNDQDDNLSCSGSVDDEPPFAFVDALVGQASQLIRLMSPIDHTLMERKLEIFKSPSESQETAKTAMASSILYSPLSHSQVQVNSGFSDHQPDKHRQHAGESKDVEENLIDEDFEFDAAVSLFEDSPMLGRSSHFMEKTESEPQHAQHKQRAQDSMGFSELMQAADDQDMHQAYTCPAMPTLLEDSSMDLGIDTPPGTSSILTPKFSNQSILGLLPNRERPHNPRSPNLFNNRGIDTKLVDQDTFHVSMRIYSDCSTRDVMDIVGNPDLLRLWCEPVRTVVVTHSSEGSRSSINRTDSGRGDREYDGEWIEATTSPLENPNRRAGSVYQMGRMFWSRMGFPSYGRITMFVERRLGRVGITMGPFIGDLTAFHTITAELGDGFVHVMDRVRIAKENGQDHSSLICCCGLCEVMQRCFSPPKLNGHIDQSVASMARLRAMIENGDCTSSDLPPDLILDGEEEPVSRQPLLS